MADGGAEGWLVLGAGAGVLILGAVAELLSASDASTLCDRNACCARKEAGHECEAETAIHNR